MSVPPTPADPIEQNRENDDDADEEALPIAVHAGHQQAVADQFNQRSADESAGLDNFLGYETKIPDIFNKNAIPGDLVNADSDSTSSGTGSTARAEEIDLRMAAVVTQIMPNGNLVIQGSQQVRVNFEMRDLSVKGVIRPEDITSLNEVPYDKIAEARIAYGGEGTISDLQQPRYGQQIFDILFPF